MIKRMVVLSAAVAFVSLLAAARAGQDLAFDAVIRGGTVYDGAGGPGVRADLGIRGDRIAAVGNLASATAP